MSQLVKITNISHTSAQGATSAWIASRNLSPGMAITVPVSDLPQEWERLGTIFSFEFVGSPETLEPQVPSAPGISLPLLEQILDRVVSKHLEAHSQKLNEQAPQMTKEDLMDALSNHLPVMVHSSSDRRSTDGLKIGPAYVPDIETVEESTIEVVSSSMKGQSVKSIKDMLKKIQKG